MERVRFATILILFCLGLVAFGQDLNSEKPSERRRAVNELGQQGPTALPRIAPSLKDVDAEVRKEAVKVIAEIGTQDAIPLLIQATEDGHPDVQILAVDGLVNIYLPGYFQTGVSAIWSSFARSVKGRFVELSEDVIDPYVQVRPEVIAAIGKLITNGQNPDAKANAARGVGILRGKQAVPQLLEGLKHRDGSVIYESLNALQKIGDPDTAPKIAYLLNDPERKIQIAAIETTGMLRNQDASQNLEALLTRSRHRDVRRAALSSIAMIAAPGSRDTFLQYINDRDDGLRAAAAEGIGRLGNRADVQMLRDKFEAENKRGPRLSMAFGLVKLGDNSTNELSPLTMLVGETNKSAFRSVATAFLIELARDADVRTSLYRFLESGTRDERIALCQVMARSGGADSIPYLERLSQDRDVEVGKEALRALQVVRGRAG
jgi:HEAT repeat protein